MKAENGEIINSFTRLLNYIYKNMAQTINQRIDALRALLKREGIDAFIIPSTDPHLSEYVAPYWKSREWISGFTGSAGTAVITSDKAGLWTDSRYFLQAEQQLEGSGIDLYKEMLPETPSILDFLRENLTANSVVGIDGKVFSTTQAIALQEDLAKNDITVKSIADPMNEIWTDRPPMPEAPAFIHEMKYAGKSCPDKLAAIRREMKKSEADVLLVSALDEIAWTRQRWALQPRSSKLPDNQRTRNTLFHPARESNGRAFSLSGRSRRHHPCLWGHRILCDKNTGRQHHARHGKDELCRLFRPPPFLPGT